MKRKQDASLAAPREAQAAVSSAWRRRRRGRRRAASAPPGWPRYDARQHQRNRGLKEPEEQKALSRRVTKYGNAFQNYRRTCTHHLQLAMDKKRGRVGDRKWTAEDMDECLNEFVTFEAQVAHRNELFVERKDPNHADHGKPLPIQIRPSDVMLWRICFAQAHSDVVRKHFADAGGDLEADSEAQSSEQVARFYDQWKDQLKQMSDSFDSC